MRLIRIMDGKYPCTQEDVGNDHPSKYIPTGVSAEELKTLGYAVVQPYPAPGINPDVEKAIEVAPLSGGNGYIQQWEIVPLPAEEQEANLAAKANQLRILATNAAQTHIDAVAQARGYDSGLSCISYAGSGHPKFGAEGAAFRAWRDAVWDYCHALDASIQEGTPMPSMEDYITGMPEMVWPG
ncbi:MAG: hypothetical protein EOM03_19080 [Clostridia bacterium]|nr:hypothetical protein [Clostridia bacterium]